MKILALNWQDLTNPFAGGAEVQLEELLVRFIDKGHEATLFCSSYNGARSEETINGIKIIRRGGRRNFNWIAPLYLRKIVREGGFDVLIEGINKIPFFTPCYLKIPTLVMIPHLFSTTVFHEVNFALASYVYLAEKPLTWIYRGRRFNAASESTRDDIIARGVPAENVSVVHCGIDHSLYSFDPKVRKFENPTILYLGRIKKYKSIDHLILAFQKVLEKIPNAELHIVGKGDYLEPLKQFAGKSKIRDRVHFPGFVTAEQKVDYFRRSHVAVYPSMKEGWGLTNIEANACGTAAVAANVPGLRNSIDNNNSGYLYEYGNIDELAAKLIRLLTDIEERSRLEKGGLVWASKFDWDTAAAEFFKELETVVARGK